MKWRGTAKASAPRQLILRCPSDKSITHRAFLFAAMAKGRSIIRDPLLGEDCLATLRIVEQLGCSVRRGTEGQVEIESAGWKHWPQGSFDFDCANSGTTARLLTGILAATPGLRAILRGDASLSRRPMGRVVEPLRELGASIDAYAGTLPIEIKGRKLNGGRVSADVASAQVKSALMFAGLGASSPVEVSLPQGSRDHTEKFFEYLGLTWQRAEREGRELITVFPLASEIKSFDVTIPADPSSALFPMVAAAFHPGLELRLKDVLQNPQRDFALEQMKAAGLNLGFSQSKTLGTEKARDVCIQSSPWRGIAVKAADVPRLIDEIPILAVWAMFAESDSQFEGVGELRVKESDRLQRTIDLIRSAGGEARLQADTLHIKGLGPIFTRAFTFNAEGDHRMAMAATILATRSREWCTVEGVASVEVSFPGFYDFLQRLDVATFELS